MRGSSRRIGGPGVLLLAALLAVSGCAGTGAADHRTAPAATSSAAATSSPAATRRAAVSSSPVAARTDISPAVAQVRAYVSGAAWNGGRVPTSRQRVAVDEDAAGLTGRLTLTETIGRTTYAASQSVVAGGIGDAATFALTVRSRTSDPATVIDVLHRSGNPGHDYLLTGSAFRSIAPTEWVTVPARFGNGLGCLLPGRAVLCQVTADLLANQGLAPSLPTNKAVTTNGTGTITSAITLRQLLALDVWRLRTTGAAALAKAPAGALDHTLIPVRLTYYDLPGSTRGRPDRLTVNGRVVVGGATVVVDLQWDESSDASATDLHLPVPTRALYTVLTSAKANQLFARAARSE